MVIGIPAGSFSSDLSQKTGDYFFVVLRSPQEASRQQTSSPIKGLRMGPQLGIGESLLWKVFMPCIDQGRDHRGGNYFCDLLHLVCSPPKQRKVSPKNSC